MREYSKRLRGLPLCAVQPAKSSKCLLETARALARARCSLEPVVCSSFEEVREVGEGRLSKH
jgi:hypothetical protein